jgi:RNA polymerase sigma-54 factor
MLKSKLSLNLSQKLKMTPQLQQAIHLLQLSSLELFQEVQQKLYSNPLLELEENESDYKKESSSENTRSRDTDNFSPNIEFEKPHELSSNGEFNSKTADVETVDPCISSLRNHLISQLNLVTLSEIEYLIGVSIIDSIDEKGMLITSAIEIQDLIGSSIKLEEVYDVLRKIQQFDPPGVGASSLTESFVIQLDQLPKETKYLSEAKELVSNYSEYLKKHDKKLLKKVSGFPLLVIEQILVLLKTLSPYPGYNWDDNPIEYVIPDVKAFKLDGSWHVLLNGDLVPKLNINSKYEKLIKRGDNGEDNDFIKKNLSEAKWFIQSIENRNDTLLKVASCIIEEQKDFLEKGAENMKPMVLKNIANKLDLHESTVSRITTQKYISTPLGVFELKYFFSSHIKTSNGEEFSSTAIRAILKKLIDGESAERPLSDNKLGSMLHDQGISIARRTVAKYRESLGIVSSSERKHV